MKIQRHRPKETNVIPTNALVVARDRMGRIISEDGKAVMKKFWKNAPRSKYDPVAEDAKHGGPRE